MPNNSRIKTFVGFSIKARKCLFGYDQVYSSGKAKVVLYSADTAPKAILRLTRYCEEYSIPCYICQPNDINDYVSRVGVKVIGITEQSLADAVISEFSEDIGESK